METQIRLCGFLFTYLFYQVNKLPPENGEEHALEVHVSEKKFT